MIALNGPNSVIGRSVIVHAKPDDFKTQRHRQRRRPHRLRHDRHRRSEDADGALISFPRSAWERKTRRSAADKGSQVAARPWAISSPASVTGSSYLQVRPCRVLLGLVPIGECRFAQPGRSQVAGVLLTVTYISAATHNAGLLPVGNQFGSGEDA